MHDTSAQPQQRLDREAIRDLTARQAHLVWQNQPLATVELFTEDGVVDLGADGGRIEGQQALRASGIAYIDLRCIRDGQSLMGSGYHEDQYAREDGVWKFRYRKLNMHNLVAPGESWDKNSPSFLLTQQHATSAHH